MKVEFFERFNIWDLEKQINEFVQKLKGFDRVIDIKYNQTLLHQSRYNDNHELLYTAMVMYDTVREEGIGK